MKYGRNILIMLTIFSIAAISCNEYIRTEVVMYYTDSIPKIEYFYKYYGNSEYVEKELRYFPSGTIMEEGHYNHNGERHGTWTTYHDSGKEWVVENYENGKKNGKVIEWYKSGKKMYQGEYKNDLPHGKWTIWDETGKKVSSTFYEFGEVVEK